MRLQGVGDAAAAGLSRPRELASGVDALYLSAALPLPVALLGELATYRQGAQDQGSEVVLTVGEDEFGVSGGGLNRYRYCLKHPNAWIGLTPSTYLPAVYVQLRAPFLHAVGVLAAVGWVTSIVQRLTGMPVCWTVSRVDLFADVQGWVPVAEDRHRFVCRSKAVSTFEVDGVLTGFLIGKRRSGTILARVYDKTAKIAQDGDLWWFDKWADRFHTDQPVWRVEFELHREVLAQCGLATVPETLANLDRLWAYAADDWLTLRDDPGTDATRSRWPVAEAWQSLQAVALRGNAIGVERVYRGRQAGSIRRLLPSLRGYLAAAGAVLDRKSLDDLLPRLVAILAVDADETGISFESRVSAKRRRLRFS